MTDAQHPNRRTYVQREKRLLSEWLNQFHGDDHTEQHIHIGPVEPLGSDGRFTTSELNMLGVKSRWVDALIRYKDHVDLIEAKIILEPFVVAQMELYLSLFPFTPRRPDLTSLPARGVILAAVVDHSVAAMIRKRGYDLIVFKPPWVDEQLSKLNKKFNKAPKIPKIPIL